MYTPIHKRTSVRTPIHKRTNLCTPIHTRTNVSSMQLFATSGPLKVRMCLKTQTGCGGYVISVSTPRGRLAQERKQIPQFVHCNTTHDRKGLIPQFVHCNIVHDWKGLIPQFVHCNTMHDWKGLILSTYAVLLCTTEKAWFHSSYTVILCTTEKAWFHSSYTVILYTTGKAWFLVHCNTVRLERLDSTVRTPMQCMPEKGCVRTGFDTRWTHANVFVFVT